MSDYEETFRVPLELPTAHNIPEGDDLPTPDTIDMILVNQHELDEIKEREKQDACHHLEGFYRGGLILSSGGKHYPHYWCSDCMTSRIYNEAYFKEYPRPDMKIDLPEYFDCVGPFKEESKSKNAKEIKAYREWKAKIDTIRLAQYQKARDQPCYGKKHGTMKKCHLCAMNSWCEENREGLPRI